VAFFCGSVAGALSSRPLLIRRRYYSRSRIFGNGTEVPLVLLVSKVLPCSDEVANSLQRNELTGFFALALMALSYAVPHFE